MAIFFNDTQRHNKIMSDICQKHFKNSQTIYDTFMQGLQPQIQGKWKKSSHTFSTNSSRKSPTFLETT